MKQRKGYSLIECLAAITLIGVVCSSVAVALHGIRQADRRARAEMALEMDLGRLAVQLRSDAHQAESARLENVKPPPQDVPPSPPAPLPQAGEGRPEDVPVPQAGEGRLEDASTPQTGEGKLNSVPKRADARPAVLLFVLDGQQTVKYTLRSERIDRELTRGQSVLHRESYPLPATCAGRWALRDNGGSRIVSFVLESAAGQSARPADVRVSRVDAAVRLFAPSRKSKS